MVCKKFRNVILSGKYLWGYFIPRNLFAQEEKEPYGIDKHLNALKKIFPKDKEANPKGEIGIYPQLMENKTYYEWIVDIYRRLHDIAKEEKSSGIL